MSLFLRRYIHENGLDACRDKLHLEIVTHPQYPNLHHFHYNMIESDFSLYEVREARTLILDADNDWRTVCQGYSKFFNYGEGYLQDLDWKTARVLEKVDGSLIVCYWYDNKWNVCTTGTADGGPFADLFWKQAERQGIRLPETWPGNAFFYMFEYVSPETRIVVPYPEPHIYLHGVRSSVTMDEEDIGRTAILYGWDMVQHYHLQTVEQVIEAAKILTPDKGEGFVVVDKNFRRLKIKSLLYVKIHHLKDQMSARHLLDVARMNEDSEVLVYFSEIRDEVERYKKQIEDLECDIYDAFTRCHILSRKPGQKPERKAFALLAVKYPFSAALFYLLDEKGSAREWICKINIRTLLELLKRRISNE